MPQDYVVEYQRVAANLVKNPSFESGLVSGTGNLCNLEAVQENPYLGSWALRTVATSASNEVSWITPANEMPVSLGKIYWGVLFARTGTGSRDARFDILFYDTNGVLLETSSRDVTLNTTYNRISWVWTSNFPEARYARLRLMTQRSNGAIGNVTFIDAVLFQENVDNAIPDYFDGFSTGASWVGVQNASVSIQPRSTWAELTNITQISGFIGRQNIGDNFEPSRMSISARYPTGYFEPNYALRVDTPIRVKRVGSTYTMWNGRIRNVTVEWGKPYKPALGDGVSDLVDIECEGHLAQWGRTQGNNYGVLAGNAYFQLADVAAEFDVGVGTTYPVTGSPELSYSVVSDSLANWLNTFCSTIGATIKDGADDGKVGVYGRDWNGNLPVAFSDVANNSTNQVYDNIVFDSVSSDYFTEIELNTTSWGDVVVNTGVAPHRTLRQTTFSASVSQATDLANYLLGVFGENGFGIAEISCKSEAQNTWALDLGYAWWDIIGYYTTVTFRGTVYRCAILGCSFSATPNESRFTYYLADIGLIPFLILDDQFSGILNLNKIGW